MEDLKKRLTPLQWKVTQEKLTEKFDRFDQPGTYSCVVCREPLFTSNLKFDSGCGWPAFFDSIDASKVAVQKDYQLIGDEPHLLREKPHLIRKEIVCAKCRAHLGHQFEDGPEPSRKRYCVNSASLLFKCARSGQEIDDQGATEPDRDIDVCCRD